MTPPLYLLEPEGDRARWAPFGGARPICDLRAAAYTLRRRWEIATGARAAGIVSGWLDSWHEFDEPPIVAPAALRGPALLARSDVAIAWQSIQLAEDTRRLTIDGETVAWVLGDGEAWQGRHAGGTAQAVAGMPLRGAFDLLTALERLLLEDCTRAARSIDRDPLPADVIVFGEASRVVVRDASIEPGVVFDVRQGGIVVEAGAEVRHGTRLEGPCWVGAHSKVVGGFVRHAVLGPWCVVRGEVSTSNFTGYTNKSHDGFVGHTVTGHWVNLGAGTTTSNLKNTYGSVRLDLPGARVETGRQFLGSLIGDHAKTAIGTMLSTGTVIGVGASVVGGRPGKYVPPFAWGAEGDEKLTREGFLTIAERVLPRRGVAFTPERAASLAALHARLTSS